MQRLDPHSQVLAQAADWFARLQDEHCSPAEQAQWAAWHAADPAHAAAWAKVEAITQQMAALPAGSSRLLASPARRKVNQRLLLLALGLGAGAWPLWEMQQPQATHRTARGEIMPLTLADGSQLYLSSATQIQLHETPTQVQLRLLAGEVGVRTGQRPWQLSTPHAHYTPLGTRFSLRLDEGYDELAVEEHSVQVDTLAGIRGLVQAGEQRAVRASGLGPPQALAAAPLGWQTQQLVAYQMPLPAVCAALDRFSHARIDCAPELAQLQVVGVLPLDQPEQALASLTLALPVQLVRLPWWYRLQPK